MARARISHQAQQGISGWLVPAPLHGGLRVCPRLVNIETRSHSAFRLHLLQLFHPFSISTHQHPGFLPRLRIAHCARLSSHSRFIEPATPSLRASYSVKQPTPECLVRQPSWSVVRNHRPPQRCPAPYPAAFRPCGSSTSTRHRPILTGLDIEAGSADRGQATTVLHGTRDATVHAIASPRLPTICSTLTR